MGLIPDETVQQVRDRVDIVELVGRYVALKRSGVNNFGLCPFHSEKSPSFNVNSARQIFHCFGCGEGGNAITFLMKVEGLGFKDAVKRLASEAGIEIQEERLSPEQEAARREGEKLRRVNDLASAFYQQLLLSDPLGAPGRRYLRGRGYDGEIARSFQLGYAPESWEALARHLQDAGIESSLVRRLGLVREGKQDRGDYDLFRGRLIFPIFDHYGQVVAFGGRVLAGEGPKYINSPESPIYHKSRILYGLYRAKEAMRRSDTAIVVEGYFDVMALHRAGITQSVATCGTAMTKEHARLLKRYAQKLLLLFDQDDAGQKATLRALEVALPEGLDVQIVSLEAGEDPDSYLGGAGKEAFEACLAGAQPALEWYMERLLSADTGVSAQARAVDEILQRIGLLPGEIERSLYLKQLAGRTGLAEEMLQRKFSQRRERPEPRPVARPVPSSPMGDRNGAERAPAERSQEPRQVELMLLHLLIAKPEFGERILALCNSETPLHPEVKALIMAVAGYQGQDPAGLLDIADLNAQQKGILSGILMRDPELLGDDPEQFFLGCCKSLEETSLKQQMRRLARQIANLEREGDRERIIELNKEMTELGQRLKGRAE